MKSDFIIWRDVPVKIKRKESIFTKKGKKGIKRKFVIGYGDIPVAHYNMVTGRLEEVINTRGLAYAARNRLKNRIK